MLEHFRRIFIRDKGRLENKKHKRVAVFRNEYLYQTKTYNKDGDLIAKTNWCDGFLQNKEIIRNGKVRYEIQYHYGRLESKRLYDENGLLKQTLVYNFNGELEKS